MPSTELHSQAHCRAPCIQHAPTCRADALCTLTPAWHPQNISSTLTQSLRLGVTYRGDLRRLQQVLADKNLTQINIVAAGASITAEHGGRPWTHTRDDAYACHCTHPGWLLPVQSMLQQHAWRRRRVRLVNAGLSGHTLGTYLQCTSSRLGTVDISLAIVEAASVPQEMHLVEAFVRRLLALPSAPAIIFLNLPTWLRAELPAAGAPPSYLATNQQAEQHIRAIAVHHRLPVLSARVLFGSGPTNGTQSGRGDSALPSALIWPETATKDGVHPHDGRPEGKRYKLLIAAMLNRFLLDVKLAAHDDEGGFAPPPQPHISRSRAASAVSVASRHLPRLTIATYAPLPLLQVNQELRLCALDRTRAMIAMDSAARYEVINHVDGRRGWQANTSRNTRWRGAWGKVGFLNDLLLARRQGWPPELLIAVDFDVVPLRPYSELTEVLSGGEELALMSEPPGSAAGVVNTGFLVVRNTARVRHLLSAWRKTLLCADYPRSLGNQPALNALLHLPVGVLQENPDLKRMVDRCIMETGYRSESGPARRILPDNMVTSQQKVAITGQSVAYHAIMQVNKMEAMQWVVRRSHTVATKAIDEGMRERSCFAGSATASHDSEWPGHRLEKCGGSSLPPPLHKNTPTWLPSSYERCFTFDRRGAAAPTSTLALARTPSGLFSPIPLLRGSHGFNVTVFDTATRADGRVADLEAPPEPKEACPNVACMLQRAALSRRFLRGRHGRSNHGNASSLSWWRGGMGMIKPKPGLTAFCWGSTALLRLASPLPLARQQQPSRGTLSIVHLSSYSGMGIATVQCVRGCECATLEIDAHRGGRLDRLRRHVSIWQTIQHEVQLMARACMVAVVVLNRTSSGAHKFKIGELTLSAHAAARKACV